MATTFSICRHHLLLLLQLLVVGASVGLSESALNKTTITSKELRMIRARLRSLNKPPVKSIQSPDGDIIDCVPFHLQPAFDDPKLKRLIKPMDPPKMVKSHEYANDTVADDLFQLWRSSGESCPEGTVAIRRTKEEDIIRAGFSGNVWKKAKRQDDENWWLQFGSQELLGYWPSSIFTSLAGHADEVQFGGEVYNTNPSRSHTTTQMGSGHFSNEKFGRAAYFRDIQLIDLSFLFVPAASLKVIAEKPNCYDIQMGVDNKWGYHFYYGGPGKNENCR
ncbi:hypothetical protein Cni_G16863 [Canna indica]|uniref:Neprosin PEP catalytic domain-containing protein n=1 Tax=Canna indica TaxID=4628 RepID=A0AAQ3KLP1_9LILI|nr:hypothetical protein Cni_G16863 [Canna indica]